MDKIIVIKLGGSLISTGQDKLIDYDYLSQFKNVLIPYIEKGYKFAVILGGGYICRIYQNLAKEFVANIPPVELDWIGCAVNNLNAEMVRTFFGEIAESYVVRYKDFQDSELFNITKGILVCAAEAPGHSSDVDAVQVAIKVGAHKVFRLTDVDAIYDKDPNINPDAIKKDKLSWDEYFNIIGTREFIPGGHYPIDPVAAGISQKQNIDFCLMSGNDMKNFDTALQEDSFRGSIVSNKF